MSLPRLISSKILPTKIPCPSICVTDKKSCNNLTQAEDSCRDRCNKAQPIMLENSHAGLSLGQQRIFLFQLGAGRRKMCLDAAWFGFLIGILLYKRQNSMANRLSKSGLLLQRLFTCKKVSYDLKISGTNYQPTQSEVLSAQL